MKVLGNYLRPGLSEFLLGSAKLTCLTIAFLAYGVRADTQTPCSLLVLRVESGTLASSAQPLVLGAGQQILALNRELAGSMQRIADNPDAFKDIVKKIASTSIDYDAAQKELGGVATPGAAVRTFDQSMLAVMVKAAFSNPVKFLFAAINSPTMSRADRNLAVDSLVLFIEHNPYFIDGPMFRDLSERFSDFSPKTLSAFPALRGLQKRVKDREREIFGDSVLSSSQAKPEGGRIRTLFNRWLRK